MKNTQKKVKIINRQLMDRGANKPKFVKLKHFKKRIFTQTGEIGFISNFSFYES